MRKTIAALGMGLFMMLAAAPSAWAAEITVSEPDLSGERVSSGGQEYFTGDVTVSFRAESEAGIKGADLVLENKSAGSKSFTGERETLGSITVREEFLQESEPEDRRYEGTLTVKDADGDEKECAVAFYADPSAPSVSLSGAAGGGIYKTSITVKIQMRDGQLSGDEAEITIKKDGVQIGHITDVESCRDYVKELTEEGKYEISAKLRDLGGRSAEKSVSFIIDKTPPVLSEISLAGDKAEASSWYRGDVEVKASAKDALSGIQSVKLYADGSLLQTFTSEGECAFKISKGWLKDHDTESGKHSIKYVAEDYAGNTAGREVSFYADVENPGISFSGIERGAFINEPPDVTAQAEDNHPDQATVYMDIYKNGEKIDSRTGTGSCAYRPEEDGKYRIASFAEDAAKNRSDTEEITFTLDRKAPVIEMHSIEGHRKDGFRWFDSSMTSKADARDELSGLAELALFVNGQPVKTESPAGDLSATIERTLEKGWIAERESPDGSYTFLIIAKDRAGNEAQAEKKVYADVKTPKVLLSGIERGAYTRKTPRVDIKVTDNYARKNTICIRITRDGKTVHTFERSGASTYTEAFKKDGNYVISVYSVDKAGNRSGAKKLRFVKDTVAPVLSLSGAKKGAYYSSARVIRAHVKERNYKTVKVSPSVKVTLDGEAGVASFGKVVPTSRDYAQKKKFSKTGTYTITLRAEDKAGNKAEPASLTFTVDTVRPEITITGADGIKGYDAVCAPKAKVKDSYYESSSVTLTRVSGKDAAGLSYKDAKKKDGAVRSYADFKKEKRYDDIYTLTVTAKDKAGNTSRLSKTFTLCRFGSRFSLAPDNLNGRYVKSVDRDIVIAEKTPATLTEREGILRLDGRQIQQAALSEAVFDGWHRYFYTFPKEYFEKEGVYTLDTASSDSAGNASRFSEHGQFTVYVDKTPPVIVAGGVQEKSQYAPEDAVLKLAVSDNIRAVSACVRANGGEIYRSEGKDFRSEAQVQIPPGLHQTISITAADAAGNMSEYEIRGVTVSESLFIRLLANRAFDISLFAALFAAAAAAVFLLKKRRKSQKEQEAEHAKES